MPTYDYHCKTCGADFEKFQSIKADALTHCECGKAGEVERRIGTGAGIIFKGSGFYETDYKRAAEPKPSAPPATTPSPASPSSPAPSPSASPAAQKPAGS